MNDIDDSILHKPTGENWLVWYVDGDRLAWAIGCSGGTSSTHDCALKGELEEPK